MTGKCRAPGISRPELPWLGKRPDPSEPRMVQIAKHLLWRANYALDHGDGVVEVFGSDLRDAMVELIKLVESEGENQPVQDGSATVDRERLCDSSDRNLSKQRTMSPLRRAVSRRSLCAAIRLHHGKGGKGVEEKH